MHAATMTMDSRDPQAQQQTAVRDCVNDLTVIFLFRRRQGIVHFSFAGFFRWWYIDLHFELSRIATW
jgi:hypothetical protein